MKKVYLIILLCMVIIMHTNCGGIFTPGPNYKDSVDIACENRDFVNAYRFARYLDNDSIVVKKEVMYVLEEQGEAGLVRIAMIVNEHDAKWVYLDLTKMAISMGNEQLATKIYRMSDACDEQALQYAITADMEGLINLFVNQNDEYIDKENVVEYLKSKGIYNELYETIIKKRMEVINRNLEERETILQKTSLPQILSAINIVINDERYYDIKKACEQFNNEINTYNDKCLELLIDAINNKNLKIAQRAVKMLKKTVVFSDKKIKDNGPCYDTYRIVVTHSSAAITNANNTLDQAIKDGKFK